jgi:hypothetical protein
MHKIQIQLPIENISSNIFEYSAPIKKDWIKLCYCAEREVF